MIAKNNKFALFNENYREHKGYQNLNCICIEETEEFYIITGLEKITHTKNSLIVKKNKRVINTIDPSKLSRRFVIKNTNYYSLFLGLFVYKKKSFFVFANRVSLKKFPDKKVDIFEISSLIVLSIETFCEDEELTKYFNMIFKKGFYFSFDFDITKNYNKENINNFKIKKRPNWLFFTNRNFQKYLLAPKVQEWIVPVIFGMVFTKQIETNMDNKRSFFSFIQRLSLCDLLNKELKDPVVENLTVSNHFSQIDFFFFSSAHCSNISFGLSQIHNKFTYEQIIKYFQFILNNMKVKKFFFEENSNSDKSKEGTIINGKASFKSLPFQIIPFSLINENSFFNFFKIYIEPLISSHQELTNIISISSHNIIDFNTNNLCHFMSLFINFNQDLLQNKSSTFEDIKKELIETEEKIKSSLNKEKYQHKSLRNIFPVQNHQKKKITFFGKFMSNLVKITSSNSNEKEAEDPEVEETKKLTQKVFGYNKEDIEYLLGKYKIKHEENFQENFLNFAFITHNCCGFAPEPKDQHLFNYQNLKEVNQSDILIIGLQEIIEMKSKNLKDIILENNLEKKNQWEKFLEMLFKENFDLCFSQNLLGLFLVIFVKKKLKSKYDIRIIQTEFLRLGTLNFANKGCILIRISINYQIINIINCHLASGENSKSFTKRIDNLNKVIGLSAPFQDQLVSFILGDLNFRNTEKIDKVIELMKNCINAQKSEKRKILDEILKTDELKIAIKKEFNNLIESEINFLPSYKFIKGTQKYDFNEGKRIPSYTDRILFFKEKEENTVLVDKYTFDLLTYISDHKPVVLSCRIRILEFGEKKIQNILEIKNSIEDFTYSSNIY